MDKSKAKPKTTRGIDEATKAKLAEKAEALRAKGMGTVAIAKETRAEQSEGSLEPAHQRWQPEAGSGP